LWQEIAQGELFGKPYSKLTPASQQLVQQIATQFEAAKQAANTPSAPMPQPLSGNQPMTAPLEPPAMPAAVSTPPTEAAAPPESTAMQNPRDIFEALREKLRAPASDEPAAPRYDEGSAAPEIDMKAVPTMRDYFMEMGVDPNDVAQMSKKSLIEVAKAAKIKPASINDVTTRAGRARIVHQMKAAMEATQ
jgi:pyruvate/2-oxoglutarate dehydrogenase complex dihydrolipoamide acyltransferase (E2) component